MEDKFRLLRRTWLFVGVIVLMITFFIDVSYKYNLFYEFIGFETDEEVKRYTTSFFYNVFPRISLIIYNMCSVVIIGILITSKINRLNREELQVVNDEHNKQILSEFSSFTHTVEKNIEAIKANVFKSIFGYSIPDSVYQSLEKDLFATPVIRKDVRITLEIELENTRAKDKYVYESLYFTYTLENRLNVDYEHPIRVTTVETDSRCVLKELQVSRDQVKIFDFAKEKTPQGLKGTLETDLNGISRYGMSVKIPPLSSVEITTRYDLNLGMKNSHHQNAIGIIAFSYGKLSLNIKKPRGHRFKIEMFNGTLKNVPEINDNVDITNLVYEFNGAIYPGTGIEYQLEGVK